MLQHDKRIVHRNRLLDWIESNTTIYRDVQLSGSTIKTITRTQLEVTLHSKYTEGFVLSLRKAVFLH